MCMMCSDSIEICYTAPCGYEKATGGRRGHIFSLGDIYCEHLEAKFGHKMALWSDLYGCEDCDAEPGEHDTYECPNIEVDK